MYIIWFVLAISCLNGIQCLTDEEADQWMRISLFYGEELECDDDVREKLTQYCSDTKKVKTDLRKYIGDKFKASNAIKQASLSVFAFDNKPAQCRIFTEAEPKFWHLCASNPGSNSTNNSTTTTTTTTTNSTNTIKVDETGEKEMRVLFINVLLHAQKRDTKLNMVQFICFTKLYMSSMTDVHEDAEVKGIIKQHLKDTFHWTLDNLRKTKNYLDKLKKSPFPDVCEWDAFPFAGETTQNHKSIIMNWFMAANNMITILVSGKVSG